MEVASRRDPAWRDSALIAGAALLLYWALSQQTFYKIDGQFLVWGISRGSLVHDYHTFYFPLGALLSALTQPLGWTDYECARALSWIGMVGGLMLMRVTCHTLGMSRRDSNWVTAMIASSGPVVFFATVVEVHGPFFPFAGISLWTAARFVRDPRRASALVFGVGLALAYFAHPTGVLTGALLPWVWVMWRRVAGHRLRPPARVVGLTALAAAVVAASILFVPPMVRRLGGGTSPGVAASYLLHRTTAMTQPLAYGEVFANEWLLPFLPLSALALLGLLRARDLWATVAAGVALAPFLLTCLLLLGDYDEKGAYLLPLALPTAVHALRCLPSGLLIRTAVLVVTLTLSIAQVVRDDVEPQRQLAVGIATVVDSRPTFLLLGDRADFEAYHIYLARDLKLNEEVFFVGDIGRASTEKTRVLIAQLDALLERKRLEGRVLYVSSGAIEQLEILQRTGLGPAADMLVEHLLTRYELSPVAAAGFRGSRIDARVR